MLIIFLKQRIMKKISYWAKNHKLQARIIIVICFIVLNILAITSGYLLQQIGVLLQPVFLLCCFAVFIIAMIVYPSKYRKGFNLSASAFYHLQKAGDFIIVACTFCMIFYLSNQPQNLFRFYPQINANVINPTPKDNVAKPYKSISEFYSSLKDKDGNSLKWKERKKLLKEQIRSIKKDNNLSKTSKTLLIILSVLVATGLFFLVAALSCNLSCSGSDTAAAIVGIGGTAVIIFLLVLAIRAITGKKRKRKKASEKPLTNQE
jgi:arginine exporter protein ArgO